jgi:hypothetical protein
LAQLFQNFGISGGGGFEPPQTPPRGTAGRGPKSQCLSVQFIPSRKRSLKTRFIFCEFMIATLAQAVNRWSSRFKPRPVHVGFVVRKMTLGNIFFPLLRGFSVSIISGDRDSSVDIATRYGLDGPVIESRFGGEVFRTRPDRRWGPPSPLYSG